MLTELERPPSTDEEVYDHITQVLYGLMKHPAVEPRDRISAARELGTLRGLGKESRLRQAAMSLHALREGLRPKTEVRQIEGERTDKGPSRGHPEEKSDAS